MSLLQLGSIDFDGFELPSSIGFGGAQQLAVHKLVGGARVIDALGRDDASVEWSGVLTGSDAADRARTLDAFRVAGNLQTLTWDAFCYSVIIAKLRMDFRNPWWIPYRISCTIERDLAQGITIVPPTDTASVLADLASAGQFVGSALSGQIAATSALVSSTSTATSAQTSVAAISTDVSGQIQAAQIGLQSSDVGQVVLQAGLLAQLCCAQGFLNRSTTNLLQLGV